MGPWSEKVEDYYYRKQVLTCIGHPVICSSHEDTAWLSYIRKIRKEKAHKNNIRSLVPFYLILSLRSYSHTPTSKVCYPLGHFITAISSRECYSDILLSGESRHLACLSKPNKECDRKLQLFANEGSIRTHICHMKLMV